MRTLLFALTVNLLLITYTSPCFGTENLTLFKTPQAALKHCPNDKIVWLNTATGIWHTADGRWYGNTKHGAYVCENEAASAGDRASLNG